MDWLTSMCEAEGPETQVRGSVGDGPEAVLDGVDGLVDKDLSQLKLGGEGRGGEGRGGEGRGGEGRGGEGRGGEGRGNQIQILCTIHTVHVHVHV